MRGFCCLLALACKILWNGQTFCFLAAEALEVAWGKAAGFFPDPLGGIVEAVIENRNH
jgi:hypothetical protein